MELVSFGGISAAKWIPVLWKNLEKIRNKKQNELEEINQIIYGDPLDIARFYVEPDCQEMNPADQPSEDFFFSREPVMKKINEFFRMKSTTPGDNQLFVLSDAGMGKTALLTMLKLLHLTAFWPKGNDCVLKKLGPKTIDEIRQIENKSTTILLLDSLDEDSEAYGKVRERLMSVMNETRHFFKTVITCRTQFFPKTEADPFKRPGMVEMDGYICPVKYLSFFDEEKVIEYCEKRFPKKWGIFRDQEKIAEAKKVVDKMGALQCRPMLLAYIDDLMASPLLKENDSEYQIYNALVASWLAREKEKDPSINTKELLNACLVLAMEMQIRNERSIGEEELARMISGKVKPVQALQLTGRSLLNRNSKGDYRFSHYSIQEFCVAKLLLDDPVYKPNSEAKIHVTDFIHSMIAFSGKTPNFPDMLRYNLRGKPAEIGEFKQIKIKNDYEDNGNSTITDHATGLMWQKHGSDKRMQFRDTRAYIDKVNRDRLGGFDDWRLPTIEELVSLLEDKKNAEGLYIDPIFGGKQLWCWSSDKRSGGGVWNVNFSYGYVIWYVEDYDSDVRLVRPGQ